MNRNAQEFMVQKIRSKYTEKEHTQLDELNIIKNYYNNALSLCKDEKENLRINDNLRTFLNTLEQLKKEKQSSGDEIERERRTKEIRQKRKDKIETRLLCMAIPFIITIPAFFLLLFLCVGFWNSLLCCFIAHIIIALITRVIWALHGM